MDDITPLLPGDAVAFLRIADETRRFPFRPMPKGLFLIGRGQGCDLRLGGDELPDVHSVLQITEDSAEVISIARQPALLVNGETVRSSELADGDLIEIGDVRCVFRLCQPGALPQTESVPLTSASRPDELVDHVESELALIAALQRDGSDRLQELLAAAHQAVEGLDVSPTLRFADYTSPQPAAPAAGETYGPMILEQLAAHESRMDDVHHVLEQVVRQQQLITAAIQCLADRVTGLSAADTANPLRASA